MKLLFQVKQMDVLKCRRCSFIQIAEMEEYDYKEEYFDNNKYRDYRCQNRENERRKKLVKKFCSRGSRIIDIGCASGEFVSSVKDEFDIFGCDFSLNAIKIAKNKNPQMKERFWQASVKELAPDGDYYDAVCMWDVIEHIDDPLEAMHHVLSILKKDGYIFISTPDIGTVFAKIMGAKWPFMTPPEHLSFFNKRSMQYFARLMCLKIVKRSDRGKWANLGFILYKINRVMPGTVPECIVKKFRNGFLSKINIYVPTHDIQYVVLKKMGRKQNERI